MSAEVFLDTNVLVYAFDDTAPAKQTKARALMAAPNWTVSWQVVQEFANLALHRFSVPIKPGDLSDYLSLVLWPKCRVSPSPVIYKAALQIHEQAQYRLYDSLIVASAVASGATILYSEDLQSGRRIGSLQILNPFAGP